MKSKRTLFMGTFVHLARRSPHHLDSELLRPAEQGTGLSGTQIAELARALSAPDWGQGDRISITPCGWGWSDEEGCFVAGTAQIGSFWVWRDKYRHKRERKGDVCAISYTGTASMVAAKRRNYLAWCGALLDLWAVLSRPGMLDTIEITEALPTLAPWRETKAKH